MREIIATVETVEVEIMRELFEKKIALENLTKIKDNNMLLVNQELYKKFIEDYKLVQGEYKMKWDELQVKYNLKNIKKGYWTLDFDSKNIILNY